MITTSNRWMFPRNKSTTKNNRSPGSPGRVEGGRVLGEQRREVLGRGRRVGRRLGRARHQLVLLPAEQGPPLHRQDHLGVLREGPF